MKVNKNVWGLPERLCVMFAVITSVFWQDADKHGMEGRHAWLS